MKKNLLKLVMLAIVCLISSIVSTAMGQKPNAPTIDPGNCNYGGTQGFYIHATETQTGYNDCYIIYKMAGKVYSADALYNRTCNPTVKDANECYDVVLNKSTHRYISAIAVRTVDNGDGTSTTYYSDVTQVTYTYVKPEATKKVTLTATLTGNTNQMVLKTGTASDYQKNIIVTATDENGDEVPDLTYTYSNSNTYTLELDGTSGKSNTVLAKALTPGNATITVAFAGNDDYLPASTELSVEVKNNSVIDDMLNNIADLRQYGNSKVGSNSNVLVNFGTKSNPATVVARFKYDEEKMGEGKDYVFLVDKTGRGIMLPTKEDKENFLSTNNFQVGDKITGILVGAYKERTSGIPEWQRLGRVYTLSDSDEHTSEITIDRSGEADAANNKTAVYPVVDVESVDYLASNNTTDPQTASYGPYLNTMISVPGTIRKGSTGEFYLMQDESYTNPVTTGMDKHRIYISTCQMPDIDLDDYVGTSGTFKGVLIKRNNTESMLTITEGDFFKVEKLYISESDEEDRIATMAAKGSLDDEMDIYVHRTKLDNTSTDGGWAALCLPFTTTIVEVETAFGLTGQISEIGVPYKHEDEGLPLMMLRHSRAAGSLEDKTILVAGHVYLIHTSESGQGKGNGASGSDTEWASFGTTDIPSTAYTPQSLHFTYTSDVIGSEGFYFRGLYGQKTLGDDGNNMNTGDNFQKYQYASTSTGEFMYLSENSTVAFNGLRCYFYFPSWDKEKNAEWAAQGKSAVNSLITWVDATPTGIGNVNANVNVNEAGAVKKFFKDGKLVIIKDGKQYNVVGQQF